MESLLAAIGSSDIAAFIRGSRWVYPLINAAHILGVSLAVGTIIVLDARIFGIGRSVPLSTVARFLIPFTVTGILLAVAAGLLLFSVKPHDYAGNPVFQLKMALLVLALANATLLRRRSLHRAEADRVLIVGGAASLVLWTGVLFCGRLIAFVG
ncbi:DUF2214 domain-containing protein [Bauldia litoralis]|uniref:DUF2214 domain-containing protein n=1 Tax=Bauldia litoralis TaxID=665467 RepID=UPI0032635766